MVIIDDDGQETKMHRYAISLEEVSGIEEYLRQEGCFCSSFTRGDPYSTSLYLERYCRHGTETLFVLDRNIFFKLISLTGARPKPYQRSLAASILAFVKCAESGISASLAIYEGEASGSSTNWEEEWRAFNDAVDLEVAYCAQLALGLPTQSQPSSEHKDEPSMPQKLPSPEEIRPFSFIYPAVLCVANLQREGGSRSYRMKTFLTWTFDEWRFSAVVTLFAMKAFSDSPFRGAFKKINNADRGAALRGAKNAAWDMAHLTALFERIASQVDTNSSTVFCSSDRELIKLGNWLVEGMYGADIVSDFMTTQFGKDVTDLYWRLNNDKDDPKRLVKVHEDDWKKLSAQAGW